jgi:hypothetical protein
MDARDVAVATMTLVRSPEEDAALRRSLTSLAGSGLPIIVADAGTDRTFLQFLESLPGVQVRVPDERGLVAQITASLGVASTLGTRFVLYTEPDKELFFERHLREFLCAASDTSDIGVVLAARSSESFGTFPSMQKYTEGVINSLCAELIGTSGDYSYGPFLMNRSLLPFVGRLPPHLGWGWRHAIFRTAHRQGLRVVLQIGEYLCPKEQRTEDEAERAHRMRQLSQNVLGLIE